MLNWFNAIQETTKYILQSEKNNAEMALLNEMQDCLIASMTVKCNRLGYMFN